MDLICFEAVGGLDAIASIFCCKVDSLTMKYLGMPLGAPFKETSIGIPFWKGWNGNSLVGRYFTYQRKVDSLGRRVLCQVFQRNT